MASASLISWCDFLPLRSAMKPTPQASYSRRGSKSPLARGRVGAASGRRPLAVALVSTVMAQPFGALASHHRVAGQRAPRPSRTARQSAAEQAQFRAEPNAAAPWPLSRPQFPQAPPNLPDRTRGLRCKPQAGRSLCGRSPQNCEDWRGTGVGRSDSRRCAAARWPSQVKDSIADLFSCARVNCAVRQAFRLYLPVGGILETARPRHRSKWSNP
jgi:hypothetical protein